MVGHYLTRSFIDVDTNFLPAVCRGGDLYRISDRYSTCHLTVKRLDRRRILASRVPPTRYRGTGLLTGHEYDENKVQNKGILLFPSQLEKIR